MLRSKGEVDRHVRELLGKMRSDDDINRKLKGLNVARLYHNIKEYESARRYISEFLSIRGKSAEGHKLLGQIYEGLGQKENSLQSYKTSYEIADTQKSLLLKICELYQDIEADISVKLHWAEEAEKHYPQDEIITSLRHSLLTNSTGQSREELEKLYLDEIKSNPLSVNFHLVLIKFYIEWGADKPSKHIDAYNYAREVESKRVFEDSFDWYCKLEELIKTNPSVKRDEEFTEFHLHVLDRLADLSISDAQNAKFNPLCTPQHASATLSRLDKELGKLDSKMLKRPFIEHVICQFYLHLAKQVRNLGREEITMDVDLMVGLLLSHALRDSENSGLKGADLKWKNIRLLQCSHVLHELVSARSDPEEFHNKLKEMGCIKSTRDAISKLAMQCATNKDGFLKNNTLFEKPSFKSQTKFSLLTIDKEVVTSFSKDLSTVVWVLRQNKFPSTHGDKVTKGAVDLVATKTLMGGLPFSSVITMGTPESLCHLDMVAFLTGVLFCAKANHPQEYEDSRGQFLFLSSCMCTSEQTAWWDATISLLENSSNRRLNRLRSVLQKGLETIRLLGPYSPPLAVMAHIAQVFTLLVQELESSLTFPRSSLEALEERAEHYWTHVVHHAKNELSSRSNVSTKVKLFDLKNCTMPKDKTDTLVAEGRLYLAGRLAHKGKKVEAILQYGEVNTPEASFNRGVLHKECADELIFEKSYPVSPTIQHEYKKHLIQARDSLYLTLDRLRAPGVSLKHPLNEELHEKLASIEDAIENSCVKHEEDHHDQSFHLPSVSHSQLLDHVASTPFRHATPTRLRQEVRPSPERLDAQVRHLMELQQNAMKALEDQNAQMKAQNDNLMALMEKIHLESKENVTFYRNLIQDRQRSSSSAGSVQSQITTLGDMLKDLQIDVRSIATEVSELKAIKLLEKDEMKVEEREAKAAIDTANSQAHAGLYGSYPLNFYARPGYPAVPSALLAGMQRPMMPTVPAAMHSPKFLTPGVKTETTYAEPPALTPTHHMSHGPQMVSTVVSLPSSMPLSQAPDAISSSLPHSFPISMPQVTVAAFSPVQNDSSKSLMFTPEGFLPDVPPPLYSAVRPIGSPSTKDIPLGLASMKPQSELGKGTTVPKTPGSIMSSPMAKPSPVVVESQETAKSGFNKSANESKDLAEEYEPNVTFEPVIDLPDLVEVKTGEEDEDKLFGERAKLYRFDSQTKEWKERGAGELRLLKNRTDGKVRILMRRDHTHKVCANHVITKEMKLVPFEKTINSWAWAANDFADEEVKYESLAARFKTPEAGNEFKEKFDAAQKAIAELPTKPKPAEATPTTPEVVKPKTQDPKPPPKSLAEMFKPAAGSWECNMCLVRNKPDTVACCSCQTPKPGCSPAPADVTTKPSTFSGFSFGVPASSAPSVPSFSFSIPKTTTPTSTTTQSTFSFGIKPVEPAKPAASELTKTFGFEIKPATTTSTSVSESEPAKPVSFGITTSKSSAFVPPSSTPTLFGGIGSSDSPNLSTFSFGLNTSTAPSTKTSETPSKSLFGDKPTLDFKSFASSTPESASKTSVPEAFKKSEEVFSSSKTDATKDDSQVEEYEPTTDFKPVIDLPDIVEVKTGEEDEEVVFKSRCKLYRFDADTKEWKERGLGDLRILRNENSQMTRILMRREHTHKICANHVLSEEMKISAMDTAEKAWMWVANDFADEELKIEQLAAKFKTQELADEFKAKFIEGTKSASKPKPDSTQKASSPKPAEPKTSVAPDTPKSMPSIFSSSPAGRSIFGGPSTPKAENGSTSGSPEVSKTTTSPKPSIFGGPVATAEETSTSKSSIFGGPSPTSTAAGTPKSSIFGAAGTPNGVSESPKPSLFGGLSTGGSVFGGSPSTPSLFGGAVTSGAGSAISSKKEPTFGNTSILTNGETIGFGSLKNESASESVFKTKDAAAFKPQSLFGNTSVNKTTDSNASKDETEEYEPNVDFKPVIDLPDLVEVKTGEENQTVMFKERAKLYRFVPETEEWKERGIGNISILKDEETGKSRVLMRREQTHKVCANHFLTPDLKIGPMQTALKAWMWSANDFSEGELVHEKLAVRFKTQELADEFKKEFEKGQQSSPSVPKPSEPKTTTKPAEQKQESLAQMFKPASGSWECSMCLVRNKAEDTECVSCSATKPGCTPKSKEPEKPSIFSGAASGFKFGVTNSPATTTASIFGGSSTPKTESVFGSANFTFGKTSFASPSNGAPPTFMFGGAPSVNGTATTCTAKTWTPPKFGADTSTPGFTFTKDDVQPSRSRDTSQCESEGDGSHIHFEPVIPLPDMVEVSTGEETQDVLYCHRAKLYRMVNKEWKERGLGDVKILKDKQSGKIRLLMRREQVHKICLNHFLQPNMIFQKFDAKAVSWGAEDYADMDDPKKEIFSIKFKTPGIAGGFVSALSEARVNLGGEPLDLGFPVGQDEPPTAKDDVEVTYQLSASQEQVERARMYQLPDNFYLYEEAEPCEGCVGCEYDSDDEDDTNQDYSGAIAVECFFSVKQDKTWHDYGKCSIEIDYDGDVFCSRVCVHCYENYELVSDHLIGITTTNLQEEGACSLTWTTDDDIARGRRTFKATFDDMEELKTFEMAFREGKMVAERSEGGNFVDDRYYS